MGIDFFYLPVAPRWVESGQRVKGEGVELTVYIFASDSCLGSMFMKPDKTMKTASSSSALCLVPICHRQFQFISKDLVCLVHMYPA